MIDAIDALTDEQLVEQIRSHDQELFRELVRRYQEKLLRYASTFVADPATQADIVQSSFIRAFEHLHGCDTSRSFSSWMYRIVHNQAIRHIKSQKQELQWDESFEISDDREDADVEDAYIQKELASELQRVLQMLPLQYRDPISLYFCEEKSYDEIAEILRIPTATVGTRLRRGKKILQHYAKVKKI